jgi:HEAT repeat protein
MRGPAATVLFAALLSLAIVPPCARADERSDYLIRLLQTSAAFRVRTQAAISLGSGLPDPAVTAALAAALRDDNAAVRAAAASSLGRVGDPSVLGALRTAERDPEAAVRTAATAAIAAIQARPSGSGGGGAGSSAGTSGGGATPPPSGPARYYVGIGRPNVTGTLSPAVVGSVRGMVERRLGTIGGIAVAPDGESVAAAQRELRSRSLTGFYLDISVTVESLPTGAIRARVSVVVQDYPGRNVRSMLSGSATATGASSADASLIEAAVGSALNRLPTALAASGH